MTHAATGPDDREDVDVGPLLDLVVGEAREQVLRRFEPRSCVATTRVIVDVLACFGVTAEPLQVECTVLNRQALALLQRGGQDRLAEVCSRYSRSDTGGPWTIGVGHAAGAGPDSAGHVIAYLPDRRILIDGSLDQAAAPHKGLDLTPLRTDPFEDFPVLAEAGHGALVAYVPDPLGRRTWLQSRDWTRRQTQRCVEATLRALGHRGNRS